MILLIFQDSRRKCSLSINIDDIVLTTCIDPLVEKLEILTIYVDRPRVS